MERNYLELVQDSFTQEHFDKQAIENKPYVAYSVKDKDVIYTIVPAKDPVVDGPADNEIWYTTTDGNPIVLRSYGFYFTENIYQNGQGILRYSKPVGGIDYEQFQGVENLLSIVLPKSITNISYRGFENCRQLNSVTIPNSVTEILSGAFAGCTSLTNIVFTGTKDEWNAIEKEDDWNYGTYPFTVHCTDGDIEI